MTRHLDRALRVFATNIPGKDAFAICVARYTVNEWIRVSEYLTSLGTWVRLPEAGIMPSHAYVCEISGPMAKLITGAKNLRDIEDSLTEKAEKIIAIPAVRDALRK